MRVRQTAFPPQSEYGFFIKLVMRLSGGKIKNGHQAGLALLIATAAIFLISILIFARTGRWFSSGSNNLSIPVAGPEDPRFQNQQ